MKIARIGSQKILDSRGQPTLEVEVFTEGNLRARASVPAGKSIGQFEAAALPVPDAMRAIEEKIMPVLEGRGFASLDAFDRVLIELDGTPDKSNLGANTLLALSIAAARVFASGEGMPLWKYLRLQGNFPSSAQPLRLYLNLINGGAHAVNATDIQEYMVVVERREAREALRIGIQIFEEIKRRSTSYRIGDEGGVVLPATKNEAPLEILKEAISDIGGARLALDVAGSWLVREGGYQWEGNIIDRVMLADALSVFASQYELLSIEDPFGENDAERFVMLANTFKKERDTFLVGDDLTVTNPGRIQRAASEGMIGGVIIKPNQIGIVSEALQAIRVAKENGLKTIVSHRSGETMDDFIADFAWASGAFGLKAGAPGPEERLSKYERLIRIQEEAGA